MPRDYLIDGYNLIHALGMLNTKAPAPELERSRLQLLYFLQEVLSEEASRATVVFDAKHGSSRKQKQAPHFHDIDVRYALGAEADDLIETLILDHPNPRALVVISNDHRLQRAARKQRAASWTDQQFLDHLETKRHRPLDPKAALPEKHDPTPEETAHWTNEFKDLANDPDFKEVFERWNYWDDFDETK